MNLANILSTLKSLVYQHEDTFVVSADGKECVKLGDSAFSGSALTGSYINKHITDVSSPLIKVIYEALTGETCISFEELQETDNDV